MKRMNNFSGTSFGFLFCLLFLFPSVPQKEVNAAQVLPLQTCETENTSFQIGEELTYKIYYNWNFVWLSAGEVTFKVFDEGDTYHYQAIGKTYPSYEWFFKVKDEYNSWVNKKDLLPVRAERSVHEGKYKLYERISFNQKDQTSTVWRAATKGMIETKTSHTIDNCVHDILSILYNMRNKDFSNATVGTAEALSVFMDQEQYNLNFKYLGKEERKKVKGFGRFHTLKFQPQLITGTVFNEGDNMTIWVGDDKNRIPVLIESPVSVGSVKVVLKRFKNTRHAVDSKVK